MSKILKKKEKLKEGEIIPIHFDSAFHIMYANEKHLETLTVLLSRVLKIEYRKLEGNVTLRPRKKPGELVDEKECEKDVVVSVKTDKDYRIVLEVNIKGGLYDSIIDRNMYYMYQEGGHTLKQGMEYNKMPYTVLINFNTFFVNSEQKEVFEEFSYRDKYGFELTEKNKIINVNIEECYNLWYTNNYEGKFEPYEEDLMLLCAAMMVDNQDDFHNIVSMVRMKPEIKELMERVVKDMNDDENLVTEYRSWKEENRLINEAIINEVSEKRFNEGIAKNRKEMVLNMHNKNISLDIIAECANLTLKEVKEIIDNNVN